MKKSKFLVRGMLGIDFRAPRSLHFVLRYYCIVKDLHCSLSKMERKSLQPRVWRPVSIATASPNARGAPAVTAEPVEAS